MEYKVEEKSAPGRDKVEVLGATYEEGKPETGGKEGRWRQKLDSRADKLKYLRSGERYQYTKDGFGSEQRKTPA